MEEGNTRIQIYNHLNIFNQHLCFKIFWVEIFGTLTSFLVSVVILYLGCVLWHIIFKCSIFICFFYLTYSFGPVVTLDKHVEAQLDWAPIIVLPSMGCVALGNSQLLLCNCPYLKRVVGHSQRPLLALTFYVW